MKETKLPIKIIIFLIHALVGWGLCGAIVGIGRNIWAMQTTLIVHAVGAPIIFCIISLIFFKFFHFTSPVVTAVLFTLFIISMDFFVVSLIIEKSFDMFKSFLGTWLPFMLIFTSTLVTGLILKDIIP